MLVPAIILGVSIIATFILRNLFLYFALQDMDVINLIGFVVTGMILFFAIIATFIQPAHIHTLLGIAFFALLILV